MYNEIDSHANSLIVEARKERIQIASCSSVELQMAGSLSNFGEAHREVSNSQL
jgi:hypothetical protein